MAGSRPLFDPDRMEGVPPRPAVPRLMSVSQLTGLIRQTLDDHLPGTIHLLGEISNLTRAASGHLYMTLKDARSEIRAAMWRSAAAGLKFELKDGMEVVAIGHVEVYAPRGYYQFIIARLEPRGVGALELAFRQLYDRLSREGLFTPGRKKPIPRFPRRLAVVTSVAGAAIRDILHTLARRYPCVEVLVHDVRVQGEGAAEDIAAAIARLNAHRESLGGIDVIILARGGGSIEDLQAFNEEKVARAMSASRIPIITGVGHEVDTTIADFVADLRAATPTAAAEHAVPLRSQCLRQLIELGGRLQRAVRQILDHQRTRVDALLSRRCLRDPLAPVQQAGQRLDELSARLRLVGTRRLAGERFRIHRTVVRLAGVHPRHRLELARQALEGCQRQLCQAMRGCLERHRQEVAQLQRTLRQISPARIVALPRQRWDVLRAGLERAVIQVFSRERQRLELLRVRLETGSVHRILQRGFTITRRADDGATITSADQVRHGERIITLTASGSFSSRVIDDERTSSTPDPRG